MVHCCFDIMRVSGNEGLTFGLMMILTLVCVVRDCYNVWNSAALSMVSGTYRVKAVQ